MSLEYRITLAGDLPPDTVAARALPDPALRPTPYKDFLTADLSEPLGFVLDVVGEQGSYYGVATGTGLWEWEPEFSIDVTFRVTRDPDRQDSTLRNIVEIVARLLDSGSEDAAFMVNADTLLLTRLGGVIRKYNRSSWWDHYTYAADLIPS